MAKPIYKAASDFEGGDSYAHEALTKLSAGNARIGSRIIQVNAPAHVFEALKFPAHPQLRRSLEHALLSR